MRILLDEEGYGWDEAWNIVTHTVAYTNHTVLAEALERWPQQLVMDLLPRIWQIIVEISNRYQAELTAYFHGDMSKVERMAVIWGGDVPHGQPVHLRLLCRQRRVRPPLGYPQAGGLPRRLPAHRRQIQECHQWHRPPPLAGPVQPPAGRPRFGSCCRRGPLPSGARRPLRAWRSTGRRAVLERLAAIKQANKKAFASYVARESGIILNTDAVFDVQVKRLHEYKRQLLNVLHIIYEYQHLKEDPDFMIHPQHLSLRRQGGPRLLCGQADHPSHQLPGPPSTPTPSVRISSRSSFWRTTGSLWPRSLCPPAN